MNHINIWKCSQCGTIIRTSDEKEIERHRVTCRYGAAKQLGQEDLVLGRIGRGVQQQQEYNRQCDESYRRLKLIIARAVEATQNETSSREVWDQLRSAQEELKRTNPLRRDQRDELWKLLQKGFENEKRKREKQQEKWEQESAENLRHVQKVVDQACRSADSGSDFHKAFNELKEAQRILRETHPLRREDRDPLFAANFL